MGLVQEPILPLSQSLMVEASSTHRRGLNTAPAAGLGSRSARCGHWPAVSSSLGLGLRLAPCLHRVNTGYGKITFALPESRKLDTGYRHSWDRKTYNGEHFAGSSARRDSCKLTDHYGIGSAALRYTITPQSNIYVQLARGYESRGFNDCASQTSDSVPYKTAVSKNAE